MKPSNSTQHKNSEQDAVENENECISASMQISLKNTGIGGVKVKENTNQNKNKPIRLEIRNGSSCAKVMLSRESAMKLSNELSEHID